MGLCLPDERPAKLPATGSKRDRGSEAVVEGDDSGDVMQPPTAKRPSRPAPPRKPPRRNGQSTPSGPSVAAPQSASTTERRKVPPSPARDSPFGDPTGEGIAPDSSTTAQPPSPAHRSEPTVPPNASPSPRSSRDGTGTTSAPPPLCEEEAAGLDYFACGLEEEGSELLLNSRRGPQWLDRVSVGLRVPLADRGLVRSRIRLLLMRGNVVARDLGVFDFLEAVVAALDRLEPDLWPVVFVNRRLRSRS